MNTLFEHILVTITAFITGYLLTILLGSILFTASTMLDGSLPEGKGPTQSASFVCMVDTDYFRTCTFNDIVKQIIGLTIIGILLFPWSILTPQIFIPTLLIAGIIIFLYLKNSHKNKGASIP